MTLFPLSAAAIGSERTGWWVVLAIMLIVWLLALACVLLFDDRS